MLKYLVLENKLIPTRTETTSANLHRHEPQVPGDTKYDIIKISSLSLIADELVRII
jgi:hypothetical protein